MIGWRSRPQAVEEEKPRGFDDFDLRLGDLMRGERATLGKSLLDVQRELKIKATYIAAIENADVSAFESPAFIAGYIRAYSRYLGMDPDKAFVHFCQEANFTPAHGMSPHAGAAKVAQARPRADFSDPLANPAVAYVPRADSLFSRLEVGAIGSLAVLVALIGAIGYGGWSILQEVQRVQLAPVEEAPVAMIEIDPLQPGLSGGRLAVNAGNPQDVAAGMLADATAGRAAPDLLDRLYRPQALDVPVLVSRNGPIGAIDPRLDQGGRLGIVQTAELAPKVAGGTEEEIVRVLAEVQQGVEILAVRPAWVRVNSADGTVLFEKILDTGERYRVPNNEAPAVLRTGNSGSVYFMVNGQTFGPAGQGAKVAKDIRLSAEALSERFEAANVERDRDLQRIMTAQAEGSAVLTD